MIINRSEEYFKNLHNKIVTKITKFKTVNIVHGISTDVGKTYITCLLVKNANLKFKENNFAIKPIISGFDEELYQISDNYRLLSACGLENITLEDAKSISRYILKNPLSPDIAAKMQGVEIDFQEIIAFCDNRIEDMDNRGKIFIEMAGGVCSPCSDAHTMADISSALAHHNPCNILVTTPYLGSISHTITALKMLKFDVLVVNKFNAEVDEEFVESLKNHLPYEIETVGFDLIDRPQTPTDKHDADRIKCACFFFIASLCNYIFLNYILISNPPLALDLKIFFYYNLFTTLLFFSMGWILLYLEEFIMMLIFIWHNLDKVLKILKIFK